MILTREQIEGWAKRVNHSLNNMTFQEFKALCDLALRAEELQRRLKEVKDALDRAGAYDTLNLAARVDSLDSERVRCVNEARAAEQRIKELERDAGRYRCLKAAITVPHAMQSFLKHMNWHPDTFKMGIDEALDAAQLRDALRPTDDSAKGEGCLIISR